MAEQNENLPVPGPIPRMIEQLGIGDVELLWGESAERSSDALARRELALKRVEDTAEQVLTTSVAHRTSSRLGRPRKLSWHDELEIAIFIATRRLQGRLVRNAIADAGRRFNVSRGAVTRADRKHRAKAVFIACAFKLGRKRFRKIVTPAKPIKVPDFRDWSADEK